MFKKFLSAALIFSFFQVMIPAKKAEAGLFAAGLTLVLVGSQIEFNAENCRVDRPCRGYDPQRAMIGNTMLGIGATIFVGTGIVWLINGWTHPVDYAMPHARLLLMLDEKSENTTLLANGLSEAFPFMNNEQTVNELAMLIEKTSGPAIKRSLESNTPVEIKLEADKVESILETTDLSEDEKQEVKKVLL